MSLKSRYFASMLVAAGAASTVVAPAALADPVWPVGGAQSASATIEDLAAQGYDVQINWVTGYPTVPLSEDSIAIHYTAL